MPDWGSGININKSESGFEGVDVVKACLDFELEQYLPPASVTNAYLATLISVTARVNDAPWRGFNAGTILYMGVQGTQDAGGVYRLSHAFKASPNRENFTVAKQGSGPSATGITIETCKGWQYLWVAYKRGKDSDNKPLLKPYVAFVHDVYEEGDLSLLGLG